MKRFLLKALPISIILLFFCSLNVNAQIKSFTPDSIKFFEEVQTFLVEKRKKEGKEFIEQFEVVWYSGQFTESQRLRVYQIANIMLKKRMPPFPEFRNYLFSLMSYVKSGRSNESFNQWMATLEVIISKNKRKFSKYLETCNNLFTDNTFYKSASTQWQSSSADYQFVYNVEDGDSEPKIVFPSLNLRCLAKGDSSVIYNTKGVYYPLKEKWVGDGGKVNWVRAGLDENETYAVIDHEYEIRAKSSTYIIDSIWFYNAFFQDPLLGRITEKVLANVTADKASYPRFESYDKRLSIDQIVEGVDYEGGFTMNGNRLLGSGTKEEQAKLTFYKDEEPFLVVSAINFIIKPDRIASERAKAVFYLEQDSIVHPGLQMKFIKKDKMLTLIRGDKGITKSPYFNTFHNVDMYFEALYWKIDDPTIEMGPLYGSTDHAARFESVNYYSEDRYSMLQGMDRVHPLVRIKDLTKELESNEFYAKQLATHMRLPISQIIPLLMNLSAMGFVYYDVDNQYCVVKDRLYEYILARAGKTDYDVIQFKSKVGANVKNASLNLLNYDLLLRGVQRVLLSDSQNVVVYPLKQELILKQNRNFTFAGTADAGRTRYFGKEFSFEYDEFRLNLINVDSLRFRVESFETVDGEYRPIKRVTTVLEGIRGNVMIDNPFNKSGIQDGYPEYPILNVTKKSYAFYDRKGIQEGVYNRDKFFFHLEPFRLDSLDNFTKEGLQLEGRFVSAGIFPEFEEKLTVQRDYSLGFIRPTPESGFPLYGGKAKFTSDIQLSHNGLQGDGTIDFLSSTTVSDSTQFTFFPDSLSGRAKTFVNKETGGKVEFPDVDAKNVWVKYDPKKESLVASELKEPLSFFNDEARLSGHLDLRPNGMVGTGVMDFENAELTSRLFTYKKRVIDSDTAEFKLKSFDLQGQMAFNTKNVNAHIDFDERVGEFKSNGEESFVDFPVNQYICYMDRFKWFMDQNDIELEASEKRAAEVILNTDVDLSGSNFYSVHPKQDSLNFMAPKARYDLDTYTIYCTEIPYIIVADAKIVPDSGNVVIRKKAKMDPLSNAEIYPNYIRKFHRVYNATVDIFAKKDYQGTGDYTYVDENKMEQIIHFASVNVDTTYQTIAKGQVTEEAGFTLSPNFEYIGDVRLEANQKFLQFTGSTRILHNCTSVKRNWMNFSAEVNPNEIYIPVSGNLTDTEGKPIGNGVILNNDSIGLYSTFLSNKADAKHLDVITADGFLFFDKKAQEYQISNKDKLKERSLPGNFISLNTNTCEVNGDGKMNLGCDLGQIKFNPVGKVKHDVVANEVTIDASVAIDFFMNDKAMEQMLKTINTYPDLEPVDFGKSTYEKSLREELGLTKADKVISELNITGKIKKFPSELIHTLYLTDVKFKWNHDTRSYRSVGPIGLGTVLKGQTYKKLKGHIEITKKRSGDVIEMYLAMDENNWFFFSYQRNLMQALSSDEEFNTIIKETKQDDRKYKHEKGEAAYTYMISTKTKKTKFLRKFESDPE